ncbi:hypothetical protein PENANT_c017G00420 [Penicillium antarcticum]|uniref:Ubiquitin-conjugating enzyme E2-binding protein n=1 Tax=Penicillium antarcticum TaxID=416450 RepID=A0A1V6Q3C5_9EURO|nr:uncharacterized protein N7508_005452 [Penicillium antarcticum]KAJ5306437.1 hypothetical protein N7508_005452 [Penicillium antarcticum]OQD83216.1 hypothetical protein PENANT_c017G00420 [Penicillium antarcticum]
MQEVNVSLYLHAEFLPNIRQITLYVSLPGRPELNNIRPKIQLSDSRKAVTVSLPTPFQDVAETIKLPARVSEASRRALNASATAGPTSASGSDSKSSYDYSFRMQVDPNDEALAPHDELIDDFVPWTAGEMSPLTRIRCRQCSTPFLSSPATNVQDQHQHAHATASTAGWVWKDLPSGNWAEMMDFWHCHKPDPHEGHEKDEKDAALQIEDQHAHTKGYGADSQVVAIPGTVLIDVATFLLAESDCTGLKKGNAEEQKSTSQHTSQPQRTLDCTTCNAIIGMEDPVANGWRLLKANVSLNTAPSNDSNPTAPEWEAQPTETIIAAQLLELIERESARRFVVHCGQKTGLVLWVFNPDMRYSNSSAGVHIMAQQAMKVFYQECADVDALLHPEIGNPSPLSVEELELPSMIFEALASALTGSSSLLPVSARRFAEWEVGILGRFKRGKVQGRVN